MKKKNSILTKCIALCLAFMLVFAIPASAMAADSSDGKDTYTVSFIAEGHVFQEYEASYGDPIITPDPIGNSDGVRFDGWKIDGSDEVYNSGVIYAVYEDTTFVAQYDLSGHVVTIDDILFLITQLIINAIAVMINNIH